MGKDMIEKLVKMASSENDVDSLMGFRGILGLLKSEGVGLAPALGFLLEHAEELRKRSPITFDQVASGEKTRAPVSVSGMPQCRVPYPGQIEIIVPGKTEGESIVLPGAAAEAAEEVALHMKDVLAAAVINKSRFKLKLLDVKNGKGEIVETILQAEYDRQGMAPVRVWVNNRGEVAALATVLRKAVANALPDLVAA